MTAALVAVFLPRLTGAGIAYFQLEVVIIGALVVIERRVLAAGVVAADGR